MLVNIYHCSAKIRCTIDPFDSKLFQVVYASTLQARVLIAATGATAHMLPLAANRN
jgi:hypothetical protein